MHKIKYKILNHFRKTVNLTGLLKGDHAQNSQKRGVLDSILDAINKGLSLKGPICT